MVLKETAQELRRKALTAIHYANAGHPGSSLSAADIVAALFFGQMDHENDKFILSKGHAVPIQYAALNYRHIISDAQMRTLRQMGSPLQGHPVAGTFQGIDISTGSLGQGLSAGCGMAYGKRLRMDKGRVYVLLGDGELQEGQNWEAFMAAGNLKIDNLVAIVDRNKYQNDALVDQTMPLGNLAQKIREFGWQVTEIDGHDLESIISALIKARQTKDKPTAIIANTIKGKGVKEMEADRKLHNGGMAYPLYYSAMKQLGAREDEIAPEIKIVKSNNPEKGIRDGFGEALAEVGENPRIVVVDCDLGSATKAQLFKRRFPERFIQLGIAEQNAVSFSAGLSKVGYRPFITSFGAFLTQRAKDQIMNSVGYSNAGVVLVGSHSGLAIGKDGATQMGIDDLNSMFGIPNMEIYSPADINEAKQMVKYLASTSNPAYLRISRRPVPLVHDDNYKFTPGKAEVIKDSGDAAEISLFATGDMVYYALDAARNLSQTGMQVDVVNVSTLRPLDIDAIKKYGLSRKGIVSVEDHGIVGGLGTKICEVVAENGLAARVLRHGIRGYGESGDPEELYRKHQLDAKGIADTVRDFYKHLA